VNTDVEEVAATLNDADSELHDMKLQWADELHTDGFGLLSATQDKNDILENFKLL
jgi:hypothetical protein